MEAPTTAYETMLLPLAQKMSKVFHRCEDKSVRTEPIEGLGNTYGNTYGEERTIGLLADASAIPCALPRGAIPGPTRRGGAPGGA